METASKVAETVSEAIASDPSNGFVVGLGVGIVFLGLVLLVFITSFVGLFFKARKLKAAPIPAAPAEEPIPNKQEMLAAVSAVVAEELGRDVSQIKILSFKKM